MTKSPFFISCGFLDGRWRRFDARGKQVVSVRLLPEILLKTGKNIYFYTIIKEQADIRGKIPTGLRE